MNKYNLIVTGWVADYIYKLQLEDSVKVRSAFRLFEEYGNLLPSKYLKRMTGTKELWELRVKRIRIFLGIYGNTGIAVHAIVKKSPKTPHQDIETAVRRAIKAKEDLL